jgi:universal stress protein A
MAFPYRRILTPIEFDENSLRAADAAAQFARHNDGSVFLLHVVPMVVPPSGMPMYVDIYKGQEQTAREKLQEIARKHLSGVKYELLTQMGEPATVILKAERKLAADVIVMATHGRRGFSRVFLGSVAEIVLREATCPVLTVRYGESDRNLVGHWMTANPVSADANEKLSAVAAKMQEGGFRSIPVLENGKVVGIITDRDLRRQVGYEDHTEVKMAMSEQVITVTPETPLYDAARLLRERKIGALPVVSSEGQLAGIISTSDILQAFTSGVE